MERLLGQGLFAGIAWNKRPMVEADNFQVEMAFKITGQGRIGADGLALWYTAQQGTLGPVTFLSFLDP